jgi:hypothetical protein
MKNKTFIVCYSDMMRFVRSDEANEDSFYEEGENVEAEAINMAFGASPYNTFTIKDGVLSDSRGQLLMCA